jgi:hypothetical protein
MSTRPNQALPSNRLAKYLQILTRDSILTNGLRPLVIMTKQDFPRHLKLRRMHGSLYLTVPREYVYAHNLSVHDDILWQPCGDRQIKLEFSDERPQETE